MENVVPSDDENPFLFWLRFEWGSNGNPHAHGQVYVKGNPSCEHVTTDDASKEELIKNGYPNASELDTQEQAETKLGDFFHHYAKEWHPCKDAGEHSLYPFRAHLVEMSKEKGNPHSVDLLELLEKTLAEDSTDLTELRDLLLALVEDGQRHTSHAHCPGEKPIAGVHPCARRGNCLLYTSPTPRDLSTSRMPSSA